jgi:hypothetical protein
MKLVTVVYAVPKKDMEEFSETEDEFRERCHDRSIPVLLISWEEEDAPEPDPKDEREMDAATKTRGGHA